MTEKNEAMLELPALLSELVDGKLSDKDQERLREILRGNVDAQDEYRRWMALHALLHLDFSGGHAQLLPPITQPTVAVKPASTIGRLWNSPRWQVTAALVSLAASALFICWWYNLITFGSGVRSGTS